MYPTTVRYSMTSLTLLPAQAAQNPRQRTHLGHTCPVVAQVEDDAKAQEEKDELAPGAILQAWVCGQHPQPKAHF